MLSPRFTARRRSKRPLRCDRILRVTSTPRPIDETVRWRFVSRTVRRRGLRRARLVISVCLARRPAREASRTRSPSEAGDGLTRTPCGVGRRVTPTAAQLSPPVLRVGRTLCCTPEHRVEVRILHDRSTLHGREEGGGRERPRWVRRCFFRLETFAKQSLTPRVDFVGLPPRKCYGVGSTQGASSGSRGEPGPEKPGRKQQPSSWPYGSGTPPPPSRPRLLQPPVTVSISRGLPYAGPLSTSRTASEIVLLGIE